MTIDPLPRWVVLPNDPEPLRRWLRAKQAEDPAAYGLDLPPEPPSEEDL